jgi:uncharacterized membrane protein
MSKKKKHKLSLPQPSSSQSSPSNQELHSLISREFRSVRREFSGPLPPPEALEKYEAIIPNGAERIMAMAEEQGRHRRALEKKALDTDSRNSLLGVIFAFCLGLATVVGGVIIAYIGLPISGTIFGGVGLVALVYAFIYGTKERRKERESKAKEG